MVRTRIFGGRVWRGCSKVYQRPSRSMVELRNGPSEASNRELAAGRDPGALAKAIVAPTALLPLVRDSVSASEGRFWGVFSVAVLSK